MQGTITLGSATSTIFMPGNFVVDGSVILGGNLTSEVYLRGGAYEVKDRPLQRIGDNTSSKGLRATTFQGDNGKVTIGDITRTSDRRLKNVGEKFTGGMDEIKKLDLYNFTFKSDKTKTPQVDVVAQDLQKIFPNSVWEGADKYLRIRRDVP